MEIKKKNQIVSVPPDSYRYAAIRIACDIKTYSINSVADHRWKKSTSSSLVGFQYGNYDAKKKKEKKVRKRAISVRIRIFLHFIQK